MKALEEFLKDDFIVLFLDFQQLGTEDFADESTFTYAFADVFLSSFCNNGLGDVDEMLKPLSNVIEKRNIGLKDLFVRLSYVCMNSLRPIVLMIDEVDSASNNQVFIDFLAQKERFGLQIVFSKRVCTIIFFPRRSCQAQWES